MTRPGRRRRLDRTSSPARWWRRRPQLQQRTTLSRPFSIVRCSLAVSVCGLQLTGGCI
jgi:hypothetical protein